MKPATRIRSVPTLVLPLIAAMALMVLTACGDDVVRETGAYPDGTPRYEREYAVTGDARKTPHGWHSTWHPGGTRASLEYFRHGVRHGNLLQWDEHGVLVRLARCDDGRCRERALPEAPPRTTTLLAGTRFR